jgi:hypothetical protein
MLEEYDVVELREGITTDLKTGTRGAIVMVYPSDPPEYEVEFVNDVGETIAVRTVRDDQLRKIDVTGIPPR